LSCVYSKLFTLYRGKKPATMTSPSPSEFLTFHRYAVRAMPRLLRRSAPQSLHRPTPRFLSTTCPLREKNPPGLSTNSKTKTDMLPDDEHSVNKAAKGDDLDVQTSNVKDGMEYVLPGFFHAFSLQFISHYPALIHAISAFFPAPGFSSPGSKTCLHRF